MKITRRQFLGTAAVVGAAAACGGGGDGDDGGGSGTAKDCVVNGTTATIGTNHGHSITVSAADVMAGVDKTYDIMGTSAHTHSVTVTAANFASLMNTPTGSVMVTSTTGATHTHTVTILCV
jgi:hypothetical protein